MVYHCRSVDSVLISQNGFTQSLDLARIIQLHALVYRIVADVGRPVRVLLEPQRDAVAPLRSRGPGRREAGPEHEHGGQYHIPHVAVGRQDDIHLIYQARHEDVRLQHADAGTQTSVERRGVAVRVRAAHLILVRR